MEKTKKIRILFVCLGNICRSPMAEAVFRQMVAEAGLADRFDIESAATGPWEIGRRPHPGTLDVLRRNAISIGDKRARQLTRADLDAFDYIVAMDSENVADIQSVFQRRVPRLLDFVERSVTRDVPDPYYNGGFDHVYNLVQQGTRALLAHIRQKEGL